MQDFEKLGAFYLGKTFDAANKTIQDSLVMYDSKDLTTHAVCVGMTGSGKTGLCISLLEEAAIDNIPTIIIDPKGDMTNLLLTFPELKPSDFKPWINESEAAAKGISLEEFSANEAGVWKAGIEKWGQSGERIKKLKESAQFSIYTPGSNAGLPVSIMNSFNAPPKELLEDSDLFSENISSTVTGLLGLLGIDADPLRSREHILISNLLMHFWEAEKNLNLAQLIQSIQAPPITRIGAFEVDTFYPSKERFELAISLNNLLSAPGFQNWFEGEPMDANNFLYTEKGTPRVSIFYIAHLNDNERMFFVSMLLNQLISWMRKQKGTGSLRALLYFDEIFGYLPPVANPPSKKPMMLLLKQARAFGLGLVLATQNPVDLDYKALSNIGTWFIGRLQTERDRMRVLDGIEGATTESGGVFNRKMIDDLITTLDKRVFLLHNVHEERPEIFHSRWALSYLAGPLTRAQIKEITPGNAANQSSKPNAEAATEKNESEEILTKPNLPPEIDQYYLPLRGAFQQGAKLVYKPQLFGNAEVNYLNPKLNVDVKETVSVLFSVTDAPVPVDWENRIKINLPVSDLSKEEEENAVYEKLPADCSDVKNFSKWNKEYSDFIYRNNFLELFSSPSLKLTSLPEESERDFRLRLSQQAREERDAWSEKLREKYNKQIGSIEAKIRTAEEKVAREAEQAAQQKYQAVINIGTTLLGAFLGRKVVSSTTLGRVGTSMRSAGKIMKETQDVNRAKENVEFLTQQIIELEQQFKEELEEFSQKMDIMHETLESTKVRPRKTDIKVNLFVLAWSPYWKKSTGEYLPAFE